MFGKRSKRKLMLENIASAKLKRICLIFFHPRLVGDEPINQVNINGREATLPLFLICSTQSSAIHSSKRELSHMMRVWLAWMHLMLQETIVICYITKIPAAAAQLLLSTACSRRERKRPRVQSPLWKTNFDLHSTILEFCQRMWENLNQLLTHVIDLREGSQASKNSQKNNFWVKSCGKNMNSKPSANI